MRLTSTAKITQPASMPNSKRLQKSELGRDQHDGDDHEPVAQRQAATAEQAPVPDQPGAELQQQAAEHEARHVGHDFAAADQHGERDQPDHHAGQPGRAAGGDVHQRAAHRNVPDETADGGRGDVGQALHAQFAVEIGIDAGRELDAGRIEQDGQNRRAPRPPRRSPATGASAVQSAIGSLAGDHRKATCAAGNREHQAGRR